MDYSNTLKDTYRFAPPHISNIKPSEWAEKNRVMSADTSPIPGKFSYDWTPYCREIVDCLAVDHPARIVTVMKGAQIGYSTGVIETGIGWIISQSPANILLAAKDEALVKKMINSKIDPMIHSSNIHHLIRPNVIRKKKQRTGDTDLSKEFSGGSLMAVSIQNPSRMRQFSALYGFLDDFEAAKNDKDAGSASSLFETRFAAGYNRMKLFYISTPEVKQTSQIEPLYLNGDQRRYNVPCPCCGEFITLDWTLIVDGEKAGITYKLDHRNRLVDGSVGYTCQSCAGFFTDKHKFEMNINGVWQPTAEAVEPNNYSYQISALYSPSGMTPWEQYVRDYLKCCPPDGEINHASYKTFVNTCLGLTWEEKGKEIDAKGIALNTRDYQVLEVPCEQSRKDGNGEIMLITCAADMNGLVDDARLDYEVVAWSSNGTSYSIDCGSIGTFVPREKGREVEREKLSYDTNSGFSVWDRFNEVLGREYRTDDGRELNINISGLDTGHYTVHAYAFLNSCPYVCVGLKGWADKARREDVDKSLYRMSRERENLFILDVNKLKDHVSEYMELKWHGDGTDQPAGFMNFPEPSEGKYTFTNYFKHYEAEKRVVDRTKGVVWVKQNSAVQNHFWDCRIYNYAIREIMAYLVFKEAKIPNPSFERYVDLVLDI